MTNTDEDIMCHFCSNSPEDIIDTLFEAWCNESVEPEEMGLDKGRKAMRKTHLKHKFEGAAAKNLKMIEYATLAKEDAAKIFDQIENDLEDDSWTFVKKSHPEFGDNLSAVPAMKYLNNDEVQKYGDMTVASYKGLGEGESIPENVEKMLKIMDELNYNNNLKSFYGDLRYTLDRVRNYKLIKVPEELTLENYMLNEFIRADPYPFTQVRVFGEKIYVCPICKQVARALKE